MKLEESQILKVLMEWRNRISAAAWLIVKDTHAAEDIFQNVALKSITKNVVFEAEPALVSWAFITARREAIDWIRRHRKVTMGLSDELMDMLELEWTTDSSKKTNGARGDALATCLESLPDKSRKLLRLRYFEGYNCSEISEKVGIELNAVYKRLSRLHQGLKTCIEKRMPSMASMNRDQVYE
ncbi:MAG: sigma-70 family RNA polymerase sigma factor [Verrucomicrobia bacterium]|nr:sigma-70 family RNA polymerase sigma factor [Verrucomicrobiota bacterium]